MENNLNCEFYFGDIKDEGIKKMDYSIFNTKITDLKTYRLFSNINHISGAIYLSFNKKYNDYILTGDIYCISNWIILLLNKLLRKKSYLWTHGWYGREDNMKSLIKKLFFNLSDGIFLYGNYAKELMVQNGFNEKKLHIIYNSLFYDEQMEVRKTLHLKPSPFFTHFHNNCKNLIFIGRLTSTKRLDLLIKAIVKLKQKEYVYNLTIVGEGEVKDELENLAELLGVKENIWFYGASYEETEIGNLIYHADLCISPGNVGLTAIHSLTYGTPVITHDDFKRQMPEFEVIKKGITGDFFERDNLESLVNSITDWFVHMPREAIVRQECYNEIDSKWNPHYQIQVLKNVFK